jgi:hypothetical protein
MELWKTCDNVLTQLLIFFIAMIRPLRRHFKGQKAQAT